MFRRSALALVVFASACTFDTSLPEAPQVGRLLGKIDTQQHVPLEGQTITLSSDQGDKRTQLTDPQGGYVFVDLPPGLYLVSASLPGFAKASSDLLRVFPGQDTDAGTLTPDWLQTTPAQATLEGKVVAGGGGSVEGAKVEFLIQGGAALAPIAQVTVAADGHFVQQLPPGTFTLKATHPIFQTAMTDVTLGAAEKKDLSGTPLVLNINPATLTGTVFMERDGAEPVAAVGADVTIVETGAHTTAGPGGTFTLSGLAAGNYQVRVAGTALKVHDSVPSRPVTLKPATTTTLDKVTLLLDRGSIIGTVKLADNAPVSGARVELAGTVGYAALVSPSAADPSRGVFSLAGVPVGSWSVTARKDQYSNASATVMVATGAPVDTGVLTLARLFGDFLIEDADTTNTPGYTRTLGVTLNFTGFPTTGVAEFRASEDASFASVAFAPYTGKLQPFTLKTGDGAHTVYAQYKDSTGQVSQTFNSTVVLDTAKPPAPVVVFEASGTAGTVRYINHAQDLNLQISANDGAGSGLSLMKVGEALDGNGAVPDATQSYAFNAKLHRTSPTDGTQNVFVQVIDHAGNVSDVGTDAVVVDTQRPTGTITLVRGAKATDDGYTNNPLVTVNETWSDGDGGVVLVKLANTLADLGAAVYQPVSASTGWFLNPNGQGLKTVYANFRDAAGNEMAMPGSAGDTKTITYDTVAPTPAAASLVTPAVTRSPTVTMALTTDLSDLSTVEALTVSEEASFTGASTLGPAPYPGSGQRSITLSPGDGVRPIYLRFRDKSGNDAVTSVSVTLDTLAPQGSFTLTGFLADGTASATLSSAAAGTVTLTPGGASEYFLGDGTLSTCPGAGYTPITSTTLTNVTFPSSGVVRLCLRDAAGNVQGPLQQTITLDAAAPSGCLFTLTGKKVSGAAAPAGLTASTSVTAAVGNCSEQPTELVLSTATLNCAMPQVWQPFNASQTLSLPSGDGAKPVFGCVRDAARNVGTIPQANITLDTTGPSPVSAALVGSTPTNAASVTVSVSASDVSGLGASDALTASLDPFFTSGNVGPSAFPGTSQVVVPLSGGDGAKTVNVRFRDAVGNESFASVPLTWDTRRPSGSFTLAGALADGTASTVRTATNAVTLTITPDDATGVLVGDENLAACPTAAASYAALGALVVPTTMTSALNPREVRLCLRDAAGNVSLAPIARTIAFDATGPSGCALTLSGQPYRGVTPPAGKSANLTVNASVGATCSETPAEIFLTSASTTCSATASYPWQSFGAGLTAQLAGPDGTNTIFGCVRDAARNVGTLTPGTITLDTIGPTAPVVVVDGDAPYINAAQVTARGGNIGTLTGSAQTAVDWTFSESSSSFPAFVALGAPSFTFAGTGVRTVYAKFRDDVGNESAVVSDSINIDVTAPSLVGTSWAFITPPGARAGFTSNPSALFSVAGLASDAAALQLVQAGSCVAASFTGAPSLPAASPATFSLTGGDGAKTLCLRVLDAAGNGAILSSVAVTLDTVPPPQPSITTLPQLLNATAVAAFTVNTAGPASDTNFDRYEKSGGTASSWGSNAGSDLLVGSTSFSYTLQADRANVLRLRAVDKAGNVSPEDSVTITWDNTRPQAPTLRDVWIDNGSQRSSLYWRTPAATDVVAYKVYYGPQPGSLGAGNVPTGFTGTNANEGSSPISVSAVKGAVDQSITLTGLTNSSVVFATVTAVDAAGNESPAPSTSAALTNFHVALEPNRVSMNRIAKLSIAGLGQTETIAIQGDKAYVAGHTNSGGTGCAFSGSSTLTVVDLSTLASAVYQGHPDLAPPTPTVVFGPQAFADGLTCNSAGHSQMTDVLVSGSYLFFASGQNLRVFSIADPSTPVEVRGSPVAMPVPVEQLNLVGDRLFLTGNGTVVAFNLKSLYDNDGNTFIGAADIIGSGAPAFAGPYSGTATNQSRNRLFQYTSNGGNLHDWLLDSALGSSPTFGTASCSVNVNNDYLAYLSDVKGVVGGSYLYFPALGSLSIYKLDFLWSSTTSGQGLNPSNFALVKQAQTTGGQGLALAGNQAFLLSNNGLRSLDMTDLNAISESSFNTSGSPSMRTVATYGNFLVTGSAIPGGSFTGELDFFELATPRSLHEIANGSGAGPYAEVGPGFLYSSGNRVYDLHRGALLSPEPGTFSGSTPGTYFSYDVTRIGDLMVSAQGPGFLISDSSAQTDHSVGTVYGPVSDVTQVNLPAGRRVTGVEVFGNHLIAAEVRTDGLWLEVFDARPLTNRSSGTAFNPVTHTVGEYQIASFVPSQSLYASLTLRGTRAIVALDDSPPTAPPSTGIYIVDFRALVDDVAGGTAVTLGSLPLSKVRETTVRGGWLYAAGATTTHIVDIKETLTEPPTALPASPITASAGSAADAVVVYGNHLFVAGRSGNFLNAWDVRTPSSPLLLSYLPISNSAFSSNSLLETGVPLKPIRRGLAIAGTRMYSTAYDEVRIIELE
ncbi:MAG: carboxypeptidase regulatory-like domain-containing protein [Myxococcaceae bacterium]|nr:carboxypeptidase regulatory-like domain-containing protein [Myxococcaceae bacterium]